MKYLGLVSFAVGTAQLLYGCGSELDRTEKAPTANVEQEIVKGQPASSGQFPGMVSLRDDDRHICGGTLIAPQWVLTAGHCLAGDAFRGGVDEVVIGDGARSSAVGEHVQVFRAYRHPAYLDELVFPEHDIGLLRLQQASAAPVVALAGPAQMRKIRPNTRLQVAGWGALSEEDEEGSDVLQFTEVPLLPSRVCKRTYGNFFMDSMLCAGFANGQTDACYGDSGGPLLSNQARGSWQVGIVSGGIGCARPNWYGVYTNVSHYGDWIAQTQQQGELDQRELSDCTARCDAQSECATDVNPWTCEDRLDACLCRCADGTAAEVCAREPRHDSVDNSPVSVADAGSVLDAGSMFDAGSMLDAGALDTNTLDASAPSRSETDDQVPL